jgi:hypothetical protein
MRAAGNFTRVIGIRTENRFRTAVEPALQRFSPGWEGSTSLAVFGLPELLCYNPKDKKTTESKKE